MAEGDGLTSGKRSLGCSPSLASQSKLARRDALVLGLVAMLPNCNETPQARQLTPVSPRVTTMDGEQLRRQILGRGLPKQLRPLVGLHQTLGPPESGDWLAQHPEPGQTFQAYRFARPILPDRGTGLKRRRCLYVQPLGTMNEAERRVVSLSARYLRVFFGLQVVVQPMLPANLVPASARRRTGKDEQLLTKYVLKKVLKPRLVGDAVALIAFTAMDLWPGEGWNFVFGEASLHSRVAVWSMHRNGNASDPKTFVQVLKRTIKTAVHETGHMFTMLHCTAYLCIMGGINSMNEGDRAPLWLCPECLAKVIWGMGLDPIDRYEKLAKTAVEFGFEQEAAFFRLSIDQLGGKSSTSK